MAPGAHTLSKLLSSIYCAAADPAQWGSFLQQVAHHTGAHSGAIVMHSPGPGAGSHSVLNSWHLDPEANRLYQEHYGALDIWAVRARLRPSGRVLTSGSLCPQSEFRASQIYNDLMSRYGIEHAMFGMVENSQSRLAAVSLYRDASASEFQPSDIKVLELLSPHIRRAFRLHFQFSELRAQTAGLSAALDMLTTGVVLLGTKGEILLMNRAANAIAAQSDGLLVTRKGLRAERSAESAELDRLIHEVVSTAEGKGIGAGGGLSISRKKKAALQVLISPAQNLHVDLTQRLRAIAFVSDPEQKARPTHDILRAIFGLTPAECRVALLLGDGNTPREISQLLALSANTVKSQVSAIYAKTSTSRHAQLVRLLMRLPGRSSMGKA